MVLPTSAGGLEVVAATVQLAGPAIAAVVREDAATARARAEACDAPLEVLDADALLTPAFVDAHVHVPMLYFRGLGGALRNRGNMVEDLFYAVEQHVEADDVRAFARVGAMELLRAGTAQVWEHYYFGRAVAEGLADAGIAAFVAPTLQDRFGPGVPQLERQWQATLELADDLSMKAHGIFAAFGPHATDTVSWQLWQRIAAASAAHELPVHTHLAQSPEEWQRADADYGCSPVEVLARTGVLDAAPAALLVHNIYVSDADLQRMDRRRHLPVFCPFSQWQFSFPADVLRWHDAGLPFAVATDCAACNDGMDVQKELRLLAGLRTAWVSRGPEAAAFAAQPSAATARALDAVRRAAYDRAAGWDDPATLLARVWSIPGGVDKRQPAGAIAAGATAHLLAFDLADPAFWPGQDPLRALAFGSPLPALRRMWVRGRELGGAAGIDGLRHDPARAEARREADRRLQLLMRRVERGG